MRRSAEELAKMRRAGRVVAEKQQRLVRSLRRSGGPDEVQTGVEDDVGTWARDTRCLRAAAVQENPAYSTPQLCPT